MLWCTIVSWSRLDHKFQVSLSQKKKKNQPKYFRERRGKGKKRGREGERKRRREIGQEERKRGDTEAIHG